MTTTINRDALLKSISDTISDYRAGELPTPTPRHVNRWISQFDDDVQLPMLAELDHVFKKTYIPKASFDEFLLSVVTYEQLVGNDPYAFWKSMNFLNIQERGDSQLEMLDMLNGVIQQECGLTIQDCGADSGSYLYIDDGLFTGNHFKNDMSFWIESDAPPKAKVYVVFIVRHTSGHYYVSANPTHKVSNLTAELGKDIEFLWGCAIEFENRKISKNTSDVLWPTEIPDDPLTHRYVDSLGYSVNHRIPNRMGNNTIFSSEKGRHILEQELLKKGAYIWEVCPNLNPKRYQRPLGNMILDGLGFGSLVVTYRNCPNNAPLAFWVSEPNVWYPLFPRKSN